MIQSLSTEQKNNNELNKDVGIYLQELRMKKGLSLKGVGAKLKLTSGQFIWNWENGKALPPLKYIKKIAKIYDIPDVEMRKKLYNFELGALKQKWGFKQK